MSHGVRFAPSPTGRFHIGNLRTAWVSSTLAKALKQEWIVRVEDIDVARANLEFWKSQESDLAALGLIPAKIYWQSKRILRHRKTFDEARAEGRVYPCDCSRKDVIESLTQIERAPHEPVPDYSGHCRNRPVSDVFAPAETLAWRWRGSDESGSGDAIVARTDARGNGFVPGYHWACAIDDADGDYSVLVRAWDLAPVERVQSEIRNWCIGSEVEDRPKVFHTSLVVREDGGRLEKRTQGVTLSEILASEVTIASLLESFEKSFDVDAATRALRVEDIVRDADPVGESAREILANRFYSREKI